MITRFQKYIRHLVLHLLWPWLTNRLWTLMSNSHSSHPHFERCTCVRMFPTRLIRKTFMIWEKILWRQASDTVTHALHTLWQHVFLLFTTFNFPAPSGLVPALELSAGLALLQQRLWTSAVTCMNFSMLCRMIQTVVHFSDWCSRCDIKRYWKQIGSR